MGSVSLDRRKRLCTKGARKMRKTDKIALTAAGRMSRKKSKIRSEMKLWLGYLEALRIN